MRFRDWAGPLQDDTDGHEKELEEQQQRDGAAPSRAFSLGDGEPSGFDFEDGTAGRLAAFQAAQSSAKSTTPTPTLDQDQRGLWTDRAVKDELSASSPEEELLVGPGLRLETGGVLAVSMAPGGSKWVTRPEDGRPPAEPRARRRRSWLWNQFFVIEEYRGPEPVLIGRVSSCCCCCCG